MKFHYFNGFGIQSNQQHPKTEKMATYWYDLTDTRGRYRPQNNFFPPKEIYSCETNINNIENGNLKSL
jgi:hypothetical protein